MEEKITVHCTNAEEWEKVQNKIGKKFYREFPTEYDPEVGICVGGHYDKMYGTLPTHIEEGYKIITASEYLNEGGKDVSEFKKGDRVECIDVDGYSHLSKGKIYSIAETWRSGKDVLIRTSPGVPGVYAQRFKLAGSATKIQTTKENNMELNSSIRTVLVEENGATFETVEKFQKVFGKEIAENFTGAMIFRKNITMYASEIKRLDDIEAKRLKEEAKKK